MDSKKSLTLADVFSSIVSNWYIVVLSTFIFGGSFFIYFKNAKPSFKTSSILFLDFDKSINTRFGEFKPENNNSRDFLRLLNDDKSLSETTSEFNLNLTVEEFDNHFSIIHPEYDKSKSVALEIVLSDSNVDQILSFHVNHFIHNLKKYHQFRSIEYFKSKLNGELESLSREKKYLEEILPVKDSVLRAMSPSNFSVQQVSKLERQGFQPSVEDFFSPEFRLLSKELVELKNTLLKLESETKRLNQLIDELLVVEGKVKNENLEDGELYHLHNYVSVFAESDKVINVSKSVLKYTVLGLFVGLLFAIFIVLLIVLNTREKTLKE